jgi:hypothetical protein
MDISKNIFQMSCIDALTENGMKTFVKYYKKQYKINGKVFNEETEKELRNIVKKSCENLIDYEKTILKNVSE